MEETTTYRFYEEAAGRFTQQYYRGFTVVGDYDPMAIEMNGRPNWWVCTDHNEPEETMVYEHRCHGDEKWSGSVKLWSHFAAATDSMIRDAEQRLADDTYLTDEEKEYITATWHANNWYAFPHD